MSEKEPAEIEWPPWLRTLGTWAGWIAAIAAAVYLADRFWPGFPRSTDQQWRCKPTLQADLDEVFWMRDPKVEKCTGSAERATCFVSTLEHGQRRTAPVTNWDCSFRRLPNGVRALLEWGEDRKATDAQIEAAIRTRLRMSSGEFTDRMEYVTARFAERDVVLNPK